MINSILKQNTEKYKFQDKTDVRVINVDGELYFVAKDVCDCLGYQNSNKALNDHVPFQDITICYIPHPQSPQKTLKVNAVNEAGLYYLIFRCNLPAAKYFKSWVTHEVLPSIRKTGSYSVDNSRIPTNFADALQLAADQARTIESQQKQIEYAKPKLELLSDLTDVKEAIDMGDLAKVLDLGLGRNRLFALLRREKVLMNNNSPYQKYMERGYFNVITVPKKIHGELKSILKTMVYPKGIEFVRNLIIKDREVEDVK